MGKPDWQPDPMFAMEADRLSVEDMFYATMSTDLWGKSPGFDLINFRSNEGKDPNFKCRSYDVFFAAGGDIRFMLMTFDSIEELCKRCDRVNLHLNDISSLVSVRNLLMTYLLVTEGEEAIDFVINLWYSCALTSQQSQYLQNLFI